MDFCETEDQFQARYDNIEMPFVPEIVVNVTLLRFKNISQEHSWILRRFIDWMQIPVTKPDPEFRVTCPKIKNKHLNTFRTRNIKDDTTSGEINETYKFVLPNDLKQGEDFPIVFELYDRDYFFDDFIGKFTIDALSLHDHSFPKEFTFGKNNGTLEVKITKEERTSPDFRYSLGLCPEEKEFRKKRIPIVYRAMQRSLGNQGPKNLHETPVVSLVGSGGGYRAIIGMCGAMEALKDAGLLDIFTYACGLSGSAWYLCGAYARKGVTSDEQQFYHSHLRERFCQGHTLPDMFTSYTLEYRKHIRESQKKCDQPCNMTNFFPGFFVGQEILEDKINLTLSELVPYVDDGKVPFPLFATLHVKDDLLAGLFRVYAERSPYEVYLPAFGIGIKPENEGSIWDRGILVRKFPELPFHLTIAMVGNACSVIAKALFRGKRDCVEQQCELLDYIEEEEVDGQERVQNRELSVESNVDEDVSGSYDSCGGIHNEDNNNSYEEETNEQQQIENDKNRHFNSSNLYNSTVIFLSFIALYLQAIWSCLLCSIKKFMIWKFQHFPCFRTRSSLVGRTVKLYNYVYKMKNLKRHHLNPLEFPEYKRKEPKELIKKLGRANLEKLIETNDKSISFVDAGVLKNVPTDIVLRPQRTPDILIVIDSTGYDSDEKFSYMPLLSAAAHAWQSGLKFPHVDFEKITNLPPEEFLIFPSDDDDCPTVIWFTLCNNKFKNLSEYAQKSKECPPPTDGENKKFNDFPVFSGKNVYSTLNFQYHKYHFDQLKELMHFNVSSHVKEIEEQLVNAVERRRQRVEVQSCSKSKNV